MNRDRFPGLADGWARLDAPAGSQPVDVLIGAMAAFMRSGAVANSHGRFHAWQATDQLLLGARSVAGLLLGAEPHGVVFGPSMTTLTLAFAPAAGPMLRPADELVCTRLDHDANVRPWMIAAERAGATVR